MRGQLPKTHNMGHWRVLTVTAATGLCFFGAGLPAASADTGSTGALVRTAKSAPWKNALSRGVRTVTAPTSTTTTAPAVVTAPLVTVTDPAVTFANAIVTLVNAERAAAGLPALKVSTCATGYAVTWSKHMAATADFSHQSLTPMFAACAARGAGENIAFGATSPEQFMTMWMNSPGHKANILRASFTHIGVGMAKSSSGRWYATQDFLTV
jgi:uncharacterized protein YkwD